MTWFKPDNLRGNFWGGLAAMLVALPSAIAFGVAIYSPLGGVHVAEGALAGILGATTLGFLASMLGGTSRLISAPCAPAAAVLSAFVIESLYRGGGLETTLLMLSMLGLIAGMLQVVFGVVGLGRIIKYMPYPVVSGYLSGVGLYIITSQIPRLFGVPKEFQFLDTLLMYASWQWQGIVVGIVAAVIMLGAAKVTKLVPATILALLGGIATYFGLGLLDPALLMIEGNSLVVGALSKGDANLTESLINRFYALKDMKVSDFQVLLFPALTLAVLLSIDTLKTCVVVDALTRSRHNSNRELIGQGVGNMASATIGGIPGAGTMGATLVNISGGGNSRLSGAVAGVLALVTFLLLGNMIAWVPVSALAAILIVVGLRMIDMHALHLLKSRSTILDFFVIVSVVVVALEVSLIAASGIGVLLAIALFVREQISNNIVRRKTYGNETFSKQIRAQNEMELLARHGSQAVIYELQGSLFFGTADQLYVTLEPELKKRRYIILDMRRVQSVDMTAAHILEQIKEMLADQQGYLLLSHIPETLPSGKDMKKYFQHMGLVREDSPVMVFNELDDAMEWVEDLIIEHASLHKEKESLLDLSEIELFHGRKQETIGALKSFMQKRHFKAGETIFNSSDKGDELYLIRRGKIRILLKLDQSHRYHIGTIGRGAFFGEMSFLDGKPRSADAVAHTNVDLYCLSREEFDRFTENHKKMAINLLEGLARILSERLRFSSAEIRALDT